MGRKLVATAAIILSVLPDMALAQPGMENYKGRSITVVSGQEGEKCLSMLKRAIDMTAKLPAKQKALSEEVKDLRCQPRPREARTSSPSDSTIGVYTTKSPDDRNGFINFPIETHTLSPALLVRSLVGNGGYARQQNAYLAAKARAASDPAQKAEAERLHQIMSGKNREGRFRYECELTRNDLEVVKALDLGEKPMRSLRQQLQKCG